MVKSWFPVFDVTLFLGFPVDVAYAKALASANPQLLQLFLSAGHSDYLTEVVHGGLRYIGKSSGEMSSIAQIELLQNNIYSLLRKLTPQYPFTQVPLTLLAIPRAE